jgi:hypothetical protein
MKKHINLLLKRPGFKKVEVFFDYFKIITVFIGFCSLASAFVLLLLIGSVKAEYNGLLNQKTQYLQDISQKQDIEKKALYINQKSSAVNTILKNDLNFLPYYTLLQQYLPLDSNSASIESIEYNNKREVQIVLAFSDYTEFYNSLSNLQNEQFLSIFEVLKLQSFSITEEKNNIYRLSLAGKFKAIK